LKWAFNASKIAKTSYRRRFCSQRKPERGPFEGEAALMFLRKLQKEHKELQEELDLYNGNDPALFEIMKKSTQIAHDAVNRWTENVFILQKWCSSNFPEAKERLEQMYAEVGITEDFDMLD
jgi:hypothetical protein